ncbi:MAG: cobaltochelatase subunit CobN [Syntrophobacteraceae bacterium]
MKLLSIMWASYIPLLKEAAEQTGLCRLKAYSSKQINVEPHLIDEVLREMKSSDLILLYRTADPFWDEVEREIKSLGQRIAVVVVGPDPSCWALSNVSPEIVGATYRYILFNGADNFEEMLKYLMSSLFAANVSYDLPRETAWEGIYHPELGGPFASTEEYLDAYPLSDLPRVGILFSRTNWVTGNMEVEKALIRALESRGLGVLPVFFYSLKDKNLGNLGGTEVIRRFMVRENGSSRVGVLIKLTTFFLGQKGSDMGEHQAQSGVDLLSELNIPMIGPTLSYYKNKEKWLEDPQGLGQQVAWSMALPEFEGVVEPIVIGAARGISQPEDDAYEPIQDRMEKLAARISRWMGLSIKPNREKKIAFILHNNPCASVEATVGGGAHLDTLESVAQILKTMKDKGYAVTHPASGKELIDEILARKAISEFRWTTTDEIVAKGGALVQLENKKYLAWFEELPEAVRNRMIEAWGEPPGEERDGIPAAMVYKGKILITGVQYGNAVVCVQPKRGCAGARCDGQVCKILHDPEAPPPHQYLATYKWLSREFGADAVIHVGTHGNLEFLPGKATGLSSGCFPDAAIDEMPHFYLYNADNPPEGTIAKRRSYATLIDHMQAVMVQGELYGELDEMERLLFEYDKLREIEPGKAHTIQHMIEAKLREGNLDSMIRVPENAPFSEVVRAAHEVLSLLKNSYIPNGMHVFGKLPEGDRFVEFVYAVLRYDNSPESLRGVVKSLIEEDSGFAGLDEAVKKDLVDKKAKEVCSCYLNEGIPLIDKLMQLSSKARQYTTVIDAIQAKIDDVKERTLLSDETGSLLNGLNGGFIPPGPSGIITRGRDDILPTGRNFYSLDPQKIPSPVAWEVGVQLARKTLGKYLEEEKKHPENIGFYWQCTDIMWADGEGMAQMMYLLGAKPLWRSNGRVKGFEIIPIEELDRPRIDVTVRVSGITRDNFPASIEMMDEIVQAVAKLDEPVERNFIRKHLLEQIAESGETLSDSESFRKATYRFFASKPGVYQAGTQLAVYASAWKDAKDLSDIFLHWNGYAYGKGVFGEPAHEPFMKNLKTVELTFNKTVTDEYDLLGCCAYFGAHGGMINAAKTLSGKDVKSYYGDTREQGEVRVRDLADEMRRVVRTKLLNPKWIDGMKEHGYKGAGEIAKRIGRVYGWDATSSEVDDWIFDDITRTFMMDDENKKFFEENNPYGMEEIARRLIEAAERGLWNPAPDVKDALKEIYIEIEGWIEEKMGDMEGDFQGGSIDIVTSREVEGWRNKMHETLGRKA